MKKDGLILGIDNGNGLIGDLPNVMGSINYSLGSITMSKGGEYTISFRYEE